MAHMNDKDKITGVDTTGHEWDGLKELNNPAPRWWLWVFFITVIWSVGYWIVYPAWPTLSGNTQGSFGWTSYRKLKEEQQEITDRRGVYAEKVKTRELKDIHTDPELNAYAIAGGKTMFRENCAACHGTGAQGGRGYPNLNDDDWLWGGRVDDIYTTIRYGIRSGHETARMSQMPAFGEMLKPQEIDAVADQVLSFSGKGKASEQGQTIFKQNCAACHGDNGHGKRELGAPNLVDSIWLYGDKKADVITQIRTPRSGVMPSWEGRLPDETIKTLAIYVHSLGGGEAEKPKD